MLSGNQEGYWWQFQLEQVWGCGKKGIDRLACISEVRGRRVEEIEDRIQSVDLGYEIDIGKWIY